MSIVAFELSKPEMTATSNKLMCCLGRCAGKNSEAVGDQGGSLGFSAIFFNIIQL